MNRSKQCIALAVLALAATGAQAQKAGDWVIGAGPLLYAPQDKSQPLEITYPVQSVVPGSGANVKDAVTLGLNFHYFLTDNWAGEVVMGVPPRIKLNGSGTFAPIGRLGQARLYAPAVLAKYFFGQAEDRFRISVGAGLTYNSFRSIRLTRGMQDALGGAFNIPPGVSTTSGSIGSKVAPVFNLGANYAINKNWGVSFSVSYIPLKVRANLTTSVGGQTVARSSTRIKLDPIVPYLYVTYRF